eukprot:scaffold2487_cov62-Phaeocystis_antarctica.AAC.5
MSTTGLSRNLRRGGERGTVQLRCLPSPPTRCRLCAICLASRAAPRGGAARMSGCTLAGGAIRV